MLMREDGDNASSAVVKQGQLFALEGMGVKIPDIAMAFDDRQEIVAMYLQNRIPAQLLTIHDHCAYTPPTTGYMPPTTGYMPPTTGCFGATTQGSFGSNRVDSFVVKISKEELDSIAKGYNQQARAEQPRAVTAADVLGEMAKTFKERQSVYKDNYKMVAKLMAVLFPDGVPSALVVEDQFHLFELMLVKLSRYAISNLTHIDSVHDLAVYGAMCEAINLNTKKEA